jgi:hypothetical protein
VIPQTYPLYATKNGRAYLVVGWLKSTGSSEVYPVLAPLEQPSGTYVHRGQDLTFQVDRPALDMDATATIPAYSGPGWHSR